MTMTITRPISFAPSRMRVRSMRRQRGVMAIEFALMFLFGVMPLLLLTMSGVLIFAAQESLTLAAAEGARASLSYGANIAQREANACAAAEESMAWLLKFAGNAPNCAAALAAGGPINVTAIACPSAAAVQCIQVQTTFNYNATPFIPGTATVYGWVFSKGQSLGSTAIVQLIPNS